MNPIGRAAYISIGYVLALFHLPLALLLALSLSNPIGALNVIVSEHFLRVLGRSLLLASATTAASLILTYPVAYYIAIHSRRKVALFVAVITPMWVSYLLRAYSVYNALSLVDALLGTSTLNSLTGAFIGMVYEYYPYMFLPLYTSLMRIRRSMLDAAYSLGATPGRTFLHVVFPMSLPGVVAGTILVFLMSMTEFVVPAMLGGVEAYTIGNYIWDLYFKSFDWYRGSVVSLLVSLMSVAVVVMVVRRLRVLP